MTLFNARPSLERYSRKSTFKAKVGGGGEMGDSREWGGEGEGGGRGRERGRGQTVSKATLLRLEKFRI